MDYITGTIAYLAIGFAFGLVILVVGCIVNEIRDWFQAYAKNFRTACLEVHAHGPGDLIAGRRVI